MSAPRLLTHGWLVWLPAAAALLAQSNPEPASLSGTVSNSLTGEPILRAHVTAQCGTGAPSQNQQQQQDFPALTNEKGAFSISGLPPGDCSVSVERVGFVRQGRVENYQLSNGTHKTDLKLTLTPSGAISGRVLNAAGEPAEGINVQAESSDGGEGATTDDLGAFRLGGLRPGKYRVKAAPQTLPFPPEIRSDGSKEQMDAATYYPDSLDAKSAQRVNVKAGAEVNGIEIKLAQIPILRVSGKITGMPQGAKFIGVMTRPNGQSGQVKADGTFTIWRLSPGKYTIHAQQWGQGQLRSAPVDIEVASTDLDHLELRMVPPFEIAGLLRFDDDQAREPEKPPPSRQGQPAPQPTPRRMTLSSEDQDGIGPSQATLKADDSFVLENVQPGIYRVNLSWHSGYIKSIRAGDTETEGNVLDARNGSPGPVTITLSSNYCEVSGMVSDSNGPVADARIMLVGAEERNRPEFANSDANGAYRFRVPPGKYKLAVVDDEAMRWGASGPDLEDYDPETLDLSAGDKIAKDLKARR